MKTVDIAQIQQWSRTVLESVGLDSSEARVVTESLGFAEERGNSQPRIPEVATRLLVNLDCDSARIVVVQAGSFGEHLFGDVSVSGAAAIGVDGRWFKVELAPGAGASIRATMSRYANQPSYETPWSRAADWAPILRGRTSRG